MGKQVETLQVKNGGELLGKILLLEFVFLGTKVACINTEVH